MSRIATPARGGFAQVRVHGLDRADVEAARGRRDHEHARPALELAREHDLLQVPARELARRRRRARAPSRRSAGSARSPSRGCWRKRRNGPAEFSRERYDLRTTFEAMLRLGATPVWRRSSGTCATPALIAARGSPVAERRAVDPDRPGRQRAAARSPPRRARAARCRPRRRRRGSRRRGPRSDTSLTASRAAVALGRQPVDLEQHLADLLLLVRAARTCAARGRPSARRATGASSSRSRRSRPSGRRAAP